MKIFWFDVETSGLDSIKNDILTLSGFVEIDGVIQKGINLKIQPFDYDNISPEALEVNGLKIEDIKKFDEPKVAHAKLVKFLSEYVNRYNKNDKLIPAGYNVGFDTDFLFQYFKKCNDPYCGAFIDYHKLDVASLVLFFKINKQFDFHGYKLSTIANELKIPLNAHDAREDIIATRNIYYALRKKIMFLPDDKNLKDIDLGTGLE